MTIKMTRASWLAVVAALLLFWNLGYAPFLNPDEGRYASASYEMAFGLNGGASDWLVPHLDGVTRLNKPPLVYWTTATFFKVFGPTSWAGRLPSALASLVILMILWVWGSRVWGRRAGAISALVWATAIFPAAMGRVANTDMLLAASIALASFGAFWVLEATSKRGRWFATLALAVGMGFALLSKGPVGVAFPLVGMALYALLSRAHVSSERFSRVALALAGALLIGLPWFLMVEMQRSGFLHDFIFAENLKRFSGGENFHTKASPFYYLPVVVVGLLPWTAFFIAVFGHRNTDGRARRTRLFLWIWAFGIIAFFSVSHTKLVSYVLPGFAPLALLMGAALADWPKISPRIRVASVGLALLLNLILVCTITAIPKRDKTTKSWGMAPGVLLDDRIWPREEGVRWVWILSATLALQSAGWLLCLRRPDTRTFAVVGASGSAILVVVMLQLAGDVVRYEDGSALVTAVLPELKDNEKLVNFRCFLPSAIVQTGRPVVYANFKNTSGLDPRELKASPNFPVLTDAEKLMDWLGLPEQKTGALLIVKGPLEPGVAARLHLWGRNNDFYLYGTRVKPDAFELDFVAPTKRERVPETDYVPGDDLPGSNQ
ncbi:undecaprenyl phosphate-alpha-4-amino-4-deoxy-L-arabinose arabinosyl transferase [Abditibacteriota bacterium]|nr:undecaprenyl phosphate-alpha-4-amino-4-deoxy-L-arabinose arabinosyl transferase [Abditibacteriota bacterium]